MNMSTTAIVGAAFVCAALTSVAPSVDAHPTTLLSPPAVTSTTTTNPVETVQYRGRSNDRYRGNNRGFGRNAAIGIGSLIIGGIVLSEIARADHRRVHVSDWSRCAQTYRSFESDTGMYTGYDGIRRPCPYLN